MANLVQIDKLENGDVEDSIDHFEICSLENERSYLKKALTLRILSYVIELISRRESLHKFILEFKRLIKKAFPGIVEKVRE